MSSSSKRLCRRDIEVILESDSEAFSEEENASQEEEEQQQQQQQPASEWRLPAAVTSSSLTVHSFTGGPRGMKIGEAPHINKGSHPLAVFMFFAEVIGLLVVETNRYYHQYLDTLD
jgi:hypothetical protein